MTATPRIRVEPREREQGELDPRTRAAVLEAVAQHGCVVLEQVFPPDLVDAWRAAHEVSYGGMTSAEMHAAAESPGASRFLTVGDDRFEISLTLEPPFDAALYSNPIVRTLATDLLGHHKLNSATVVVAHPGAGEQHIHRDHPHLFPSRPGLTTMLPTYAINVAIPLIDLDLAAGPTGLWVGSHATSEREGPAATMVAPTLARGDCLILDYRTLHRGTPNVSARPRPVVYLVYARPWFFDDCNHHKRRPVMVPPELYPTLSPDHQELLSRAWSHQLRASQR